ncbi:perlucin-like [Saccostrea echinata]|uniref:perlucin-like n=1 Tax=Saccostrea echinata TaxID=191078 RepID=UPI002A7FE5E4|nr:perlucin-like [Saccostrea echinata]
MAGEGCAGILYNDKLFSCKLLKCHLNQRSVNRTRVEVGWEFWSKNTICPIGWEPFEGRCYFPSKTKKTWNDSKEECEQYGAPLVEIATPAENTWLMEAFLPPWSDVDCSPWHTCCKCWIGATDMDSEGVFTWNRHTNITFSTWYPSEPSNSWGNEHCVSLCRNGLWNDSGCKANNTFICEKE